MPKTETIRRSKRAPAEWYVKIDGKWRRKAVVIVEAMIGRKPRPYPTEQIWFVDGDRLNCVPSNLLLVCGLEFRTCRSCGDLKVVPASAPNAGRYVRYCGKCRSRRPSTSARP